MPNLHDIERRINSVTSTKQITRTMEMVAAAKIRRASVRMENSLPWAAALSDMLVSTAAYSRIKDDPLINPHDEVKHSVIVVVSSDRGLAGGFNSNALRAAEKLMREKEAEGIKVSIIACGKKACGYFEYRGIKPLVEVRDRSADPTYAEASEIAEYVRKGYLAGDIDEVLIVFNHMVNAGEQRLVVKTTLPIPRESFVQQMEMQKFEKDLYFDFREHIDDKHEGAIEFEPDTRHCLIYLEAAYLRTDVYFALVDSAAAEQGARRTAMKSATDNATEMISTLTRIYNRERQGAITTEISEIVGGAAALEE
ncbi:MAG: ATP synthase F1 subunit gamma [Coriobacteriaceae bacterium]|nr:ATP synthase F1 subunit gamma [Coriobacteriaceae bacterium]